MSETPPLDWQQSPILPKNPTLTQEMAAARAKYVVSGQRQTIFRAIRESGEHGCTDSELQEALDISGNSERPRRKELQLAGYVKDSGRIRSNSRGNFETVWVAV